MEHAAKNYKPLSISFFMELKPVVNNKDIYNINFLYLRYFL